MARVTVEDCVDKVPNRFDLVMLAAHRAREIASGAPLSLPVGSRVTLRVYGVPDQFRLSEAVSAEGGTRLDPSGAGVGAGTGVGVVGTGVWG